MGGTCGTSGAVLVLRRAAPQGAPLGTPQARGGTDWTSLADCRPVFSPNPRPMPCGRRHRRPILRPNPRPMPCLSLSRCVLRLARCLCDRRRDLAEVPLPAERARVHEPHPGHAPPPPLTRHVSLRAAKQVCLRVRATHQSPDRGHLPSLVLRKRIQAISRLCFACRGRHVAARSSTTCASLSRVARASVGVRACSGRGAVALLPLSRCG